MNGTTVTQEHINTLLANATTHVQHIDRKKTIVQLVLPNGFVFVESSSCVDSANYDGDIGTECCMEQIQHRLWEFEGYLLQQRIYEEGICKTCIEGQCGDCEHYEGSD